MKKYTVLILFAAVMAVGGILAANGLSATPFFIAESATKTLNSGMPITGHITMVATDANGNIKAYRQTDNLVVNVGETCTGARLFGSAAQCTPLGLFNNIAIGIGTGAEDVTNTALGSERNTRQTDATNTITNSTGLGATSSISGLFAFTASYAISESGIFDSSGNGTGHMFARKLISPVVNVASGDSLTVTWTITTGS